MLEKLAAAAGRAAARVRLAGRDRGQDARRAELARIHAEGTAALHRSYARRARWPGGAGEDEARLWDDSAELHDLLARPDHG